MNVDNAKSQMRKGMLVYCVMLLLRKEPSYASDIITRLKEADFDCRGRHALSAAHPTEKGRTAEL